MKVENTSCLNKKTITLWSLVSTLVGVDVLVIFRIYPDKVFESSKKVLDKTI